MQLTQKKSSKSRKTETSKMNIYYIIALCLYTVIAFIVWPVLTCFMHDEKKELNGSWTMSIILGMFGSIIWPVSLWAVYTYHKEENEQIQKSFEQA